MIKKNLPLMLITSVVILLPMLIGLALWNSLPAEIAIHWDAAGNPDGFGSRAVAVFVMPAFLLVMHWLCMLVTSADPKNKNVNGKPLTLVCWIIPFLSMLMAFVIYGSALGYGISVETVMPVVMGAMFVVIGNYLPKCKQNYTIGIKVPWALNDEENWNRTHRFAGILWVVGGILMMVSAFFGSVYAMLPVILVMCIAPMVYSYLLYRKKNH